MRRIGYLTFSFQCWLCAILSSSSETLQYAP